jgi:hypothetical protein
MRLTRRRVENIVLIGIVVLATAALMTLMYQSGHDRGVVEGFQERMRERAIESEATEI